MTTAQPLSPEALQALAGKLDRYLAGEHPVFTREDLAELRRVTGFVDAFKGDPAVLVRIQNVFLAFEGFGRVGKWLGYGLAFIVLVITNWDRLAGFLTTRGGA